MWFLASKYLFQTEQRGLKTPWSQCMYSMWISNSKQQKRLVHVSTGRVRLQWHHEHMKTTLTSHSPQRDKRSSFGSAVFTLKGHNRSNNVELRARRPQQSVTFMQVTYFFFFTHVLLFCSVTTLTADDIVISCIVMPWANRIKWAIILHDIPEYWLMSLLWAQLREQSRFPLSPAGPNAPRSKEKWSVVHSLCSGPIGPFICAACGVSLDCT